MLCSISSSILWMMAFNSSAVAQINSSSRNGKVSKLSLSNQPQNTLKPQNKENIDDLENSLIEEMAAPRVSSQKKSPLAVEVKNQSPNPLSPRSPSLGDLPVLAAEDVSQVGLELQREVKDSPSCNNARNCHQTQLISQGGEPTFNQLLNPQTLPEEESANSEEVQEFGTPGVTTSQGDIAPLPPLPGTQIQPAVDSGAQGDTSGLTFNQLLYPPKSQPSPNVPPQLSNNPLLNSPTIQPGFNQTANPGMSQAPVTQNTPIQPRIQPSAVVGSSLPSVSAQQVGQKPVAPLATTVKRKPIKEPSVTVQGVYVTQGEDSSSRARVSGVYPLSPQAVFGATLDLTSEENTFDNSRGEGLNINELYFASSLGGVPNLRFVVGQMDLTSYFDRNSFAKDGASHFFNPVFQTNPALSSTGISSRPGLLLNWSVTDNLAAKAAMFSSANALSDFTLDGFAGEIGLRYGNAILRGTYSTARDAGSRDSFLESFGFERENGEFGPIEDDREEAYGLNAEVFIPNMKLGLFARYGRYENRDLDEGGYTYSLGLSFLDLFTPDDRLGLAYGRALSNDALRDGEQPDVVELFYDFKFLPNLRFGLSFQGRESFEESVLGVRVKSEFDIIPRRNTR